jgi:aspartyl-tRNA(Asn)/glutamyl-tRNA(Gln) amidotransferase subunit A
VIIGKTVTHEFAYAPERGDGPEPRNPWHLDRLPGGSSAGSAVAPVVRSAFAAIGTDTAGSIRGPASWCGLVGIKPTYGLIDVGGVIPLSHSLDHIGPLTRTVDDCALVLETIADTAPPTRKPLRVGLERAYFLTGPLDPEVAALVEAACRLLADLGIDVVELSAPSLDRLPATGITILMAEATTYHRRRLEANPSAYSAGNRNLLRLGERISAADYRQARAARVFYREKMRALFSDHRLDLLAAPALPTAALADASELAAELPDLVRYTLPANVTGQPALVLPCGFTHAGLPVGLQLIGRPFGETTIIAAARAYEEAAACSSRRPGILQSIPHQRTASSA